MSGVAYMHDDAGQRTRMQSFMIVGCGLISLPQPGDRRGYILPWPYASRARSWAQRGQQGGRVVAAAVHDAVDEQRRRAEDLARGQAAVDVAADPVGYRSAGPVAVEGRHIQPQLGGVPAQVAVLERLLAVEQ